MSQDSDLKLDLNSRQWKQLNEECFEYMEYYEPNQNSLTLFKFPIYYLLDHIIDEFGSNEDVRTLIRNKFNLDNFFIYMKEK